MDRIRQLSPQALKWLALSLFVVAFVLVYLAQRTTSPADVVFIVVAIVSAVGGFGLWLMYGERVDGGPRR
jgi:CHASE2 domain-containing sensor protein